MENEWLRLGKEAEENEEYEQAAEYYQKAADAGDIEGWIALGNFYDDVQPNPQKARAAWIKVHEDDLAHDVKSAYWYLGGYYFEDGLYEKGIEYLEIAASLDGEDHQVMAEDTLGNLYCKGVGVAQDFGRALAWYKKAELHGASWMAEKIAECAKKAGQAAVL